MTALLARRTVRVGVALAVVYGIWGSTYLAIKVAVAEFPPFTLMAVRFAVAGTLLFVVSIRLGDRRGDRITWQQLGSAVVTGGTLLVGGTGLVALAQTELTSGTAALLGATVPVWLALFSRIRFGERLPGRAAFGLGVGLAGIALLVEPSGSSHLGAMLVALAGAAAWAAGSLRGRTVAGPKRPLVAASLEMLGSVPAFALVAFVLGEPARIEVAVVSRGAWIALAYLIVAGSIVAFTAYSWLLRNAPTPIVGTHAYINPIVAVTLGWAFAGELVTARTLLAGAVVLAGVALLVTGRPGRTVPAQPTSGGDVFAAPPRPRGGRHLLRVLRGSTVRARRSAPWRVQQRTRGHDPIIVGERGQHAPSRLTRPSGARRSSSRRTRGSGGDPLASPSSRVRRRRTRASS